MDKINQTMVHETGHALGMCCDEIKVPGIADPAAEHAKSYTARGHQGGHCATGIADADYNDASKKLSGLGGTCVLYGEGGGSRLRSFCAACAKILLPADVRGFLLAKL